MIARWLVPCFAAVGAAQSVTTMQLSKPLELTAATAVDVDGDGSLDLVLACGEPAAKRRELRIHLRAASGVPFRGEPSRAPYALERDVVAFAFADVDARPGRELVLFTAERGVAVLPGEGVAAEYRPLFTHRVVWPAADPEAIVDLCAAVVDVDGDGRDDFVLPEPDGGRVVRQQRSDTGVSFVDAAVWRLPAWRSPLSARGGGPARLNAGEFQLRFGAGERDDEDERGPLVSVQTRTPPFALVDFDGDGARDVVAMRNERLWRWGTRPEVAARATEYPLPLPEDRLTLFDPAFDVQLADVDGDRDADLLLTTSATRSGEVEVRIDLFVNQGGTAPWSERAQGRLRVQTLARPGQLVDVDGDGQLDLVATTLRTDRLRALASSGPTSLEAQLNVYRGAKARFQVPAALVHVLQLPAGKGRPTVPFLHVLPGTAGAPGALLVRSEDRVLLQPIERDGDSLRLGEPTWQLPIPAAARLSLPAPNARELLVLDQNEAWFVRLP